MKSNHLLITLAILILPILTFISCSSDEDEPQPIVNPKPVDPEPEEPELPTLSGVAVEFIEYYNANRRIVLPDVMMQADIENQEDIEEFYAAYTTEWAMVFNAFPDTLFNFLVDFTEEDFTHSTTPVGGSNASLGADVYTWNNAIINGVPTERMVYQVLTHADSYTFELFLVVQAGSGETTIKILEATEAKDHSTANYKYFFAQVYADEEEHIEDGSLMAEYTWEGDILRATMTVGDEGYSEGTQDDDTSLLTLTYDRNDKSGDLIAHDNRVDIDIIEAYWSTDGNGEITITIIDLIYDDIDGVVTDWIIAEPYTGSWF